MHLTWCRTSGSGVGLNLCNAAFCVWPRFSFWCVLFFRSQSFADICHFVSLFCYLFMTDCYVTIVQYIYIYLYIYIVQNPYFNLLFYSCSIFFNCFFSYRLASSCQSNSCFSRHKQPVSIHILLPRPHSLKHMPVSSDYVNKQVCVGSGKDA